MLKIQLANNQGVIEGSIFAIDPVTHAIVIKTGGSSFSLINADKIDSIEGELPNVASVDIPTSVISSSSLQGLEKNEQKNLLVAEKRLAEMNHQVLPEVQALFDRVNFIFPCSWCGESILVVDQFRVDPPYTANDVERLTDSVSEDSFNRFIKVLEGDKRRNRSSKVNVDNKRP